MAESSPAPPPQEEPKFSTGPGSDKSQKSSIETLGDHHRETLKRAISNIISTQAAEIAYAQVVDGLPLRDVVRTISSHLTNKHPIWTCHETLCPGVVEKVHKFRDTFRPEILTFDSSVLLAYQAAGPASRAFNTRLIELVALAVHQIAVLLFNLDMSLHKEDGVNGWKPPKDDLVYWEEHPNGPLPTLMYHPWYVDFEQYPGGVADMVGFWAESQILGGVALFDRRPESEGAEPDAVYWHPNRIGVTYRICKLLPGQKQKLLDFLLSTEPQEATPLPLLPNMENLSRVDPEEPIAETGIFRHSWERKKPPPPNAGDRRLRDVWDLLDFPTAEDKRGALERAYEGKRRGDLAEAFGVEVENLDQKLRELADRGEWKYSE